MNSDKRRPRILICENIHEDGIRMLRNHADVDYLPNVPAAELQDIIVTYDGLIVGRNVQVDANLIRHGLNLKIIGRADSRFANIDLDAVDEADITVVNSPDANTVAVAEHTMALMLALARQLPQAVKDLKTGQQVAPLMGLGLAGKTIGIVGFGRVGRQVAIRAQAFGMKVLVNQIPMTPELKMEESVRAVDLNVLLRESDFVTLHIPLRAETEDMIAEAQLAQMKSSAYLINTARSGVIDESALLTALQNGRIAGAALDVFTEGTEINQTLIQHPSVIATPHIAASTDDAQQSAAVTIAELFIDFFQQVDVETVLPLRVVPMDRVFPHENIDLKRVNRLAKRLDEEGILGNPPIVTEVGDGTYMVLDGATRSSAMKQLHFPHAVVQVINSEDGLGLKTWYHVIQQITVKSLIDLLQGIEDIILERIEPELADKAMFEYGGLCYIHTVEDHAYLVKPVPGVNRLDALNQLTEKYIEAAHVDRTLNDNIISLKNEYDEMAAVVIFPEYTVQQVIQTTLESGRLFPAGITRFLIPGRILRLKADLSVLRSKDMTLREKNRWLHEELLQKQAKGGIRFYGESVYLLDE